MVIRNYHWLNSASRVLISTCSAPLVQTGERKQFSLFDLDLWPTTLTSNPRLAKVKIDPHDKNQGHRSNGSNRRAPTDKRTDTHTGATKRIISPTTRSIKMADTTSSDHKCYEEVGNLSVVSLACYEEVGDNKSRTCCEKVARKLAETVLVEITAWSKKRIPDLFLL